MLRGLSFHDCVIVAGVLWVAWRFWHCVLGGLCVLRWVLRLVVLIVVAVWIVLL